MADKSLSLAERILAKRQQQPVEPDAEYESSLLDPDDEDEDELEGILCEEDAAPVAGPAPKSLAERILAKRGTNAKP